MFDRMSVAARYAVVGACLWLPQQRQKSIERWLRGREEFVKTRAADRILMSFGKSGRTWLRVMPTSIASISSCSRRLPCWMSTW